MDVLINSVSVLQLAHLKSKQVLQQQLLKKVLLSTFFIALFCSDLASALTPSPTPNDLCPKLTDFADSDLYHGQVQWLPDGDTIHTKKGNKLRLLHINAPEMNPTSDLPPQAYAKASLSKLKQLAAKHSTIYWVYDKKKEDRYKRELAFVFNQQGQFINQQMITAGLAQTLVVPPNQQYWQCITQAEQQAIKAKRGIWSKPEQSMKSTENITKDSGFTIIHGKITKIVDSNKYRWLIVNDRLWVGIKRKDMRYFQPEEIKFNLHDSLTVRGYIYQSYGKLRMNLRHPSMLLPL